MAAWKEDWETTRQRFLDWWNGDGFILSSWEQGCPAPGRRENVEVPGWNSLEEMYTDPRTVALRERDRLSRLAFPGDIIPFAHVDWGTVAAAPFFGATMEFGEDTVWYNNPGLSPQNDRDLILADDNPWFLKLLDLVRTGRAVAGGDYFCGIPAVCPGLDVLAELCGPSELCMLLITDPVWVQEKLKQITAASLKAYNRIYDLIREEDGSCFHAFFRLWAPGRVSLIQNDFSSLISEDMFREFAVPFIREYGAAMDYTLFHVDGPDAIRTVDALLEIDEVTSLQFTPGPQVPGGGDVRWYDMYRRIKAAGKRMQVTWMKATDVVPLLDAVGPEGLYLMVEYESLQEAEETARQVESYRR